MKKSIILFLAALFSAYFANSQSQQLLDVQYPVVNSVQNIPMLGDSLLYVSFSGGENFSPGDTGSYVVWDFSNLNEISDSTEHYEYIDTTGTYAGKYTGTISDVSEAISETPDNYFYYDYGTSGNEWRRSGFYAYDASQDLYIGIGYGDSINHTSIEIVNYPLHKDVSINYNYSGVGKWGMPSQGVDNEPVEVNNGSYSMEADGFGVLILPDTTYTNAVRVHVLETFTLTLYLYGTNFNETTISDDYYYWYVPGMKSFVMKYGVSQTSGASDQYSLAWQKVNISGITADFTVNVNDTLIQTTDSVMFINLSSPMGNSSFEWTALGGAYTFVGGTDANSQNPIIQFQDTGYYDIRLIVTNGGNTDTITKTHYIHVTKAPEIVADFHADQTVIGTNQQVHLYNDTYIDPSGSTAGTEYTWYVMPPVGWAWSGCDEHSEEVDVYFTDAGCYSIKLIAANSNYTNQADTIIKQNYINVGGGCGDVYTATFTVTDMSTNDAIQGAEVAIDGGQNMSTDANGQVSFDLYNGTYTYTVSKSGYADTSGTFDIADADVNINVVLRPLTPVDIVDSHDNIIVYPNPTNGIVNIKSKTPANIKIVSMNGKVIFEKNNVEKDMIDLTNVAKGIYIIEIKSNTKIIHSKLIIK